MDALVKICKLTETCGKSIILVDSCNLENLRIRMECHHCTCIFGLTHNLNRLVRLTLRVLLDENLALTMNLCLEIVGQGIHAGHTHTVKTTGNLVTVLAELTAGMKHCKNDFKSRTVLLLVHSGRDTTSIILYCN